MTIHTALHKIAQAEADLDERLKAIVKSPDHRLDIVSAISELITAKIEAEQTRKSEDEYWANMDDGWRRE